MIDLDDIESRINDGIYGDDRMTDTARDDAFSALAEIIAQGVLGANATHTSEKA